MSRVAGRVGYDTPSAFVAAFRRETGQTPAAYFRSRQDLPESGQDLPGSARTYPSRRPV